MGFFRRKSRSSKAGEDLTKAPGLKSSRSAPGRGAVVPDTPDNTTASLDESVSVLRSISVARSATGDFEVGFEDEVRRALFAEEEVKEEEAFDALMRSESHETKSFDVEDGNIISYDDDEEEEEKGTAAPKVISTENQMDISDDIGGGLPAVQSMYRNGNSSSAAAGSTTWRTLSCSELPKPDVGLFYDKMCKQNVFGRGDNDLNDDEDERPYRYDSELAVKFVKHMTGRGFDLLCLQAPHSSQNKTDDWKGRSVTMVLEPGTNGDRFAIQPKIVWATMPGGNHTSRIKTSISLLRIHSIDTTVSHSSNFLEGNDEDELCYLSITTDEGNVHLFEASSVPQRDMIVKGLRNIVARLAFQLVIGDVGATTEFYDANKGSGPDQELHSLAIPRQNLDRISHILLD